MNTILTPEFQAELDTIPREAARKAVIEATEKWQKQQSERMIFEACRSHAQAFLAERKDEIRADFEKWIKTRLDEAVEAAAKQTLDQIVADVKARLLGRK